MTFSSYLMISYYLTNPLTSLCLHLLQYQPDDQRGSGVHQFGTETMCRRTPSPCLPCLNLPLKQRRIYLTTLYLHSKPFASPGRVVRVRDCASRVVGLIPTQGTSTSVLVTLNPYGIGLWDRSLRFCLVCYVCFVLLFAYSL
jgi:hypothetical protein